MKKKTAGLAAIICAAGLLSVSQADMVLADGGFSYEDVANREFLFCSGAGAWSTVLTIHEDGTFEGYYHDTDIGIHRRGKSKWNTICLVIFPDSLQSLFR